MNPISLITDAVSLFKDSKVGQSKIKGFNQNVGELVTSKTNIAAGGIITYAITTLMGDPDMVDRIICNVIIVYSVFQPLRRDTQFKKTP